MKVKEVVIISAADCNAEYLEAFKQNENVITIDGIFYKAADAARNVQFNKINISNNKFYIITNLPNNKKVAIDHLGAMVGTINYILSGRLDSAYGVNVIDWSVALDYSIKYYVKPFIGIIKEKNGILKVVSKWELEITTSRFINLNLDKNYYFREIITLGNDLLGAMYLSKINVLNEYMYSFDTNETFHDSVISNPVTNKEINDIKWFIYNLGCDRVKYNDPYNHTKTAQDAVKEVWLYKYQFNITAKKYDCWKSFYNDNSAVYLEDLESPGNQMPGYAKTYLGYKNAPNFKWEKTLYPDGNVWDYKDDQGETHHDLISFTTILPSEVYGIKELDDKCSPLQVKESDNGFKRIIITNNDRQVIARELGKLMPDYIKIIFDILDLDLRYNEYVSINDRLDYIKYLKGIIINKDAEYFSVDDGTGEGIKISRSLIHNFIALYEVDDKTLKSNEKKALKDLKGLILPFLHILKPYVGDSNILYMFETSKGSSYTDNNDDYQNHEKVVENELSNTIIDSYFDSIVYEITSHELDNIKVINLIDDTIYQIQNDNRLTVVEKSEAIDKLDSIALRLEEAE